MRIYLHINYFETDTDLPTALVETRALGATGLEFRRVPNGLHRGGDGDYLDQISRAWDRNPVSEVSFGAPGPNLMLADRGRREAELEAVCAFYARAVKRFPVKVINLLLGELINPDESIPLTRFSRQGSSLATAEQWEWAVEGCRVLAALAGDYHFQFGLETHGIYLHDTVAVARRLVERVDRRGQIGITWDHANEYLFDETPDMEVSLETCLDRLFYVHLKNLFTYAGGGYRICGLSEGRIDVRQQCKLLASAGFDGPVAIESPRQGDRLHFLQQDFAYLEELLAISAP